MSSTHLPESAAGAPTPAAVDRAPDAQRRPESEVSPRVGGACLVAGALTFAAVRLLHGDTPAGEPDATLTFMHHHTFYPVVHVVAALAMLPVVTGLLNVARSFTQPAARFVGRSALMTVLVGWAVFTVESTSEGLGLPVLAEAAEHADPGTRASLVTAMRAVAEVTYGPSLMGMALMIGLPLLLLGSGIMLEAGRRSWLGLTGAVIGAATAVSAVSLFVHPDLFPGAILYGVLGSVAAQLWLVALGTRLLRGKRTQRA